MRYFQAMAGSDAQMQRLIAGWQALSRNEPGSAEQIAKALLRRGARDAEFLVNAANLLAVSLMQQARHEEALKALASALERDPLSAGTRLNLGSALIHLGRLDEAVSHLAQAVQLDPRLSQAHSNLGLAFKELGRFEEAIESYGRALRIAPGDFEAHSNLGMIYRAQGRRDEAIASLERALSINPGHVDALLHLGAACQEHNRLEEAVGHFTRAIALDPQSANARHNLGAALQGLSRHDEAIASFREALRLDPLHKYTPGALLWSELLTCRWEALASRIADLKTGVRKGEAVTDPFGLITVSEDPEEQLLSAERFYEDRVNTGLTRLWNDERYRHEKIRVAYVSGDFREHAVAYCIAELLERHDRSRFEVIGVSLGVDDGSAIRSRLVSGFDRFLNLRSAGDRDVAKRLRDEEVDIAVDLMGYTKNSRPGVLAHRPSPIQVGYFGYTAGADFLDYILADRFVLPEEHQGFYSERIVYLPDSYQANDSKREIAEHTPSRAAVGLPEDGFVYCCFNNSYKILPTMFDVWMRLLTEVPGSVLWILEDNAAAAENLRREARTRGVDPGRLVFAPRVGAAEYRARCRLADLCLDTLPYNGHGTTSDMLWAGLPVLTCAGTAFAGRVAGSLLHAVGLPELVTASLEEYQALAVKLARGDRLLGELRARLQRNRASAALFDTDRFRRHIESAYRTMWEIWQHGDKPRAFAVEPVE